MTLKAEVKKGNVGTTIDVTLTQPQNPAVPQGTRVPVDLTNSTVTTIVLRKPTGGSLNLTSTVKTPPGTDGIITHTDSSGVFTVKGRWQARGEATFSGGDFFQGSWKGFYVGV